ncbi:hypothetical protein AYL99_12036 [Fonsecaea erecta]|uniref:Uncharacterized protein n=1 Tax=Fonsecaea erecta TaxID=1367422 RepID=A0A178Z1T2_9EURO|nr:hypothetical protein AYL99_12036 [Fonsecaea erecta]OAP53752.1 hypothetical protein AYL99_12036 [Fonsecaea erecta]
MNTFSSLTSVHPYATTAGAYVIVEPSTATLLMRNGLSFSTLFMFALVVVGGGPWSVHGRPTGHGPDYVLSATIAVTTMHVHTAVRDPRPKALEAHAQHLHHQHVLEHADVRPGRRHDGQVHDQQRATVHVDVRAQQSDLTRVVEDQLGYRRRPAHIAPLDDDYCTG